MVPMTCKKDTLKERERELGEKLTDFESDRLDEEEKC